MARLRALRAVMQGERVPPAVHEVKADINVTPLVDVVLVLLIIFMVVTPLIASGVAVDLPKTAHHSRKPDDGKDIIVSVTEDGRVYIGTRQLASAEDLGAAIAAEQRRFPDKSLFLKGDGRARFGTIRKVVKTLREANVTDIVMGTEELTKTQ
jgi:biopolymer transport protein ExbD/biopolymer transport protein TolR